MSISTGVYKGLRVVPQGADPEPYQNPDCQQYPGPTSQSSTQPGEAPARHLVLPEVDERHRRDASPIRGARGLCVDELCTCGKHSCPPTFKSLPFEGSSTYADTYVKLHTEKRPEPPVVLPTKTLPFEGSTTYGDTFQPGVIAAGLEARTRDREAAERRRLIGPDGKPMTPEEAAKAAARSENRDFCTTYEKVYKKPHIEHHAFWDSRSRQWY